MYTKCECCGQELKAEHLQGETRNTLNIHGRSKDPRARLLSPLAARPFRLGNLIFSSFEGFYQGLKFPEDDPRRVEAFASAYGHAKKFGPQAEGKYAWWGGEQFAYASKRHREIIELGGRASIVQCADRSQALLDTGNMKLTHETNEERRKGGPIAPWTASDFCELMERIREELRARSSVGRAEDS